MSNMADHTDTRDGRQTTGGAETMRAVVQDRFGSVDELRLARVPLPEIADDEVLVQVRAAGLDRGTWHLMSGRPYLMRVIGFGFRGPKNRVPGLDVAGTVAAVGSGVTRFAVGDEVFGTARGSFAEYAVPTIDTPHAVVGTRSFAHPTKTPHAPPAPPPS